jgi:hypothetical protein
MRKATRGLGVRVLLAGICLTALPAQAPLSGHQLYFVPSDQPGKVMTADGLSGLSSVDRAAAIPFALPWSLQPISEPYIPPYAPYCIDPGLPLHEQAALVAVAEGLRVSQTGRNLYAFLRQRFGPLSGSLRVLTLTLASMGESGDMAVTSGTPPVFQITLNRDCLAGGGPAAMVPKLGHEIVHVRDYVAGQSQAVALEVSAHAADMALTYEVNMAVAGTPDGPGATFNSLTDVYHGMYVPYRGQPTAEGYARYWQALMAGVCEARPYRNLYRAGDGQTLWNSPAGPPMPATYVPYDPALGLPGGGGP